MKKHIKKEVLNFIENQGINLTKNDIEKAFQFLRERKLIQSDEH